MYCIFQTAPGKLDPLAPLLSENIKVVNVGSCQSNEEIARCVALHGWLGENWFVSTEGTAEDALRDAIASGFNYRSREEMGDLEAKLREFQ